MVAKPAHMCLGISLRSHYCRIISVLAHRTVDKDSCYLPIAERIRRRDQTNIIIYRQRDYTY